MRVAVIVLGLVVVSTPSQASSSCMTRPEAQQFATSYLYWYGSSHLYWYRSGHCWRAMTPSRRTRVVHRVRVVFNGIAWADHSHALKPENRSQDRELVQREAQAEPNNPEPKWREAMSGMLTANEAPSPSVNWENRWVEIAQIPLGGDKARQADASAKCRAQDRADVHADARAARGPRAYACADRGPRQAPPYCGLSITMGLSKR